MKRPDIEAVRNWVGQGRHDHGGKPDCWVDEKMAEMADYIEYLEDVLGVPDDEQEDDGCVK